MCLILIKIGKLIGLILAHEAINIWFYVGFKEIVYIYIKRKKKKSEKWLDKYYIGF